MNMKIVQVPFQFVFLADFLLLLPLVLLLGKQQYVDVALALPRNFGVTSQLSSIFPATIFNNHNKQRRAFFKRTTTKLTTGTVADDNNDKKNENNPIPKTGALRVGLNDIPRKLASSIHSGIMMDSRNSKYNLIWSRSTLPWTIVTCTVIFGIHSYIASYLKVHNLVIDWKTMKSNIPQHIVHTCTVGKNLYALPMLAGSCCLIQLVMNVLAGGCAGFNSLLGPIRPLFLSLLVYITWIRYTDVRLWTHILRWFIALLPELVHFYNRYQHYSSTTSSLSKATIVARVSGGVDASVMVDGDINTDSSMNLKVTANVAVPKMGCVACVNKIDTAVRNALPLTDCYNNSKRIQLNAVSILNKEESGGETTVEFYCKSENEIKDIVEAIVESITRAGFGDQVQIKSLTTSASVVVENEDEEQKIGSS